MDFWTTDEKTVITGQEYRLDKRSSFDFNRPKFLIAAHETAVRSGPSRKANIIATSDHLDVTKNFVETDGIRHPRDSSDTEFSKLIILIIIEILKHFLKNT